MRRKIPPTRLAKIVAEAARQVASAKLTSGDGVSPAEFAATRPPPRGKSAKVPKDRIDKLRVETKTFVDSRDFSRANSGHLVALYAACHVDVYGVEAGELLDPKAWALATIKASRLTNTYFEGSAQKVVDFIRWTWAREKKRGPTAEDVIGPRRIGWQLQFAPTLVTDYRRWELHASKVQR